MKRSILALVTALTLSVTAFGTSASAQSFSNTNEAIYCGLWSGVNLDTSGRCPTGTQPSSANSITTSGTSTNATYAALGDSIAAGAGLPTKPNATSEDIQCARSSQAYPNLVAQARGISLQHIACSGATAGDLVTSQGVSGPNIGPQLDAAFASGTPALITITAGANDAHWDDFLRICYTTNCATDTYTTAANAYLSVLQLKLLYAFSSIQSRSNNSPPTVVVTGYYNPVSNQCIGKQNYITSEEIHWLNDRRDTLNKTIRDAASNYSFIKYASTNFSGHGVCSSEPWVQNLNDSAPFHPTARGQQHIAESVLNALQ